MPSFEKVTFGIRPEESKEISCWNLREEQSRQREGEAERFETGVRLVNWRLTRENSGHQEAQNKALMTLERRKANNRGLACCSQCSALGTSHLSTRLGKFLSTVWPVL